VGVLIDCGRLDFASAVVGDATGIAGNRVATVVAMELSGIEAAVKVAHELTNSPVGVLLEPEDSVDSEGMGGGRDTRRAVHAHAADCEDA